MRNFLLWLLGAGVWGYLLSYIIARWNRRSRMNWLLAVLLVAGAALTLWVVLRVPML
jgi:hypothetical protein